MTNIGIHNLSSSTLSPDERVALGLGLKFMPVPSDHVSDETVRDAITDVQRQLHLRFFFNKNQPENPQQLRIPNPTWLPSKPFTKVTPITVQREFETWSQSMMTRTRASRTRFYGGNTPPGFWKAIQDLQRRTDIVIKPADKNLGLVMIDSSWYLKECQHQLSDQDVYLDVTKDAESHILHAWQALSALIHRASQRSTITDKEAVWLSAYNPNSAKVPKFYLIIKLHKTPVVGRPIVASTQWITTRASKFVAHHLNQLMTHVTDLIPDSTSMVRAIDNINESGTFTGKLCTLVAVDIVSLYPSMPQQDTVKQLDDFLRELSPEVMPDQLRITLVQLTELILTNNLLQFNNRTYKQVQGTAMGTNLAPPVANIFVFMATRTFFNQHGCIAFRFIDDIVGLIPLSVEAIKTWWTSELQNVHPNLRFTVDTSPTHAVFLDLVVSKRPDFENSGHFQTKLYQKTLNAYLYIPFLSYHPLHQKKGWITGELKRYVRLCSHRTEYLAIREKFYFRLKARGYPKALLQRWFKMVVYADRRQLLYGQQVPRTRPTLRMVLPLHPAMEWVASLDRATLSLGALESAHDSHCPITKIYKHPKTTRDYLVRADFRRD
jgi:hypothetical protein